MSPELLLAVDFIAFAVLAGVALALLPKLPD